jgi:hypothetical protein
VWPYGLRLGVGHGSLLYLASERLCHGTAPRLLPYGLPSGRAGGGGGRGGGGAGERQLIGVALVSKADVTAAAIKQACDGDVTWRPLPA